MEYMGGPNIVTGGLIRGSLEGQSQRQPYDNGRRSLSDTVEVREFHKARNVCSLQKLEKKENPFSPRASGRKASPPTP